MKTKRTLLTAVSASALGIALALSGTLTAAADEVAYDRQPALNTPVECASFMTLADVKHLPPPSVLRDWWDEGWRFDDDMADEDAFKDLAKGINDANDDILNAYMVGWLAGCKQAATLANSDQSLPALWADEGIPAIGDEVMPDQDWVRDLWANGIFLRDDDDFADQWDSDFREDDDFRNAFFIGWRWASGRCFDAAVANRMPVFRVYNPETGRHLWTQNLSEAQGLAAGVWEFEGTAWYSPRSLEAAECVTGVFPIYRFSRDIEGATWPQHVWTANPAAEVDGLAGWVNEGVQFFSAPQTAEPVNRFWNPTFWGGPTHVMSFQGFEMGYLEGTGFTNEGRMFWAYR